VLIFKDGRFSPYPLKELENLQLIDMKEDREGNLWLGTIDNGVFERKNGVYSQYTTDNGLSNNTVTSIFKDSKGDLWFSTFDGVTVYRYQSPIFETFTSENGLSGKVVNTILENKNQDIWIGVDRGITILKGGKTGKENTGYYLERLFISCIYEDPEAQGVFWIATNGEGKGSEIVPVQEYRRPQYLFYCPGVFISPQGLRSLPANLPTNIKERLRRLIKKFSPNRGDFPPKYKLIQIN
jgi:hypothetical protein